MKPITLSSEARRKLGAGYAPTMRHPDAPLPPDNDLFARPILTAADIGKPQYVRPDSDRVYPSRGPFRGGAV